MSKKEYNISQLIYGKVPPSVVELEAAVLKTILEIFWLKLC